MAFWSARDRAAAIHDSLHVPLDRDDAWVEPEPPQRDWKKIVLIVGLAALSWVATYVGMLELIESNMGSLPLLHKVIIGFSVAMLMTMIVWLLDQIFSPIDGFTKLTYVLGYIFLSLISVGFGFGFYWKVLESRAEAARSATSAVGQVQSSLNGASTRLEQLQATLLQLSAVSTQKAELERAKGTSCPNSAPGDGPRRKMRDEDAARFTFASDFVKGRVGVIKADMAALDAELAKIVADDPSIVDPKTGTRNAFMRALGRRLDMTVTGFNAFRTDPQLRQIRTDLADRAERSTIAGGKSGTISCPDPQLQLALRGVVRAIDQLPSLEKPEIAAVEGSEATIEAFRRLTATFFGLLSFKLPPSTDELRALQQRAVQSIENPEALRALNDEAAGLSKRDYIPLGTAIFVDLCLLLVSIGRPMNRFVATRQRMLEAERGPVFPILSRFNEIHNHEELRRTFDVFREVIFESGGTYYVAVPLNAPRAHPERASLRRDAQTLANLCYALEGQGVLTRPWKIAPSLVAQRKLRRQGSKFIECYRDQQMAPVPRLWRGLKGLFVSDRAQEEGPAFRIYAFKSGAWPELILGAVMGAAGRIEADRRRQRQQEAAERDDTASDPPPKPRPPVSGLDLPGLEEEPAAARTAGLRDFFRHRPGDDAAKGRNETAPRRAEAAAPRASPGSDFHQRFGSYASHAQAELTTYHDLDEDETAGPGSASMTEPANSNTAPGEPSMIGEEPADIVVPFPTARSIPGVPAMQALAEQLSAALAVIDAEALSEPLTAVELNQEAASLQQPMPTLAEPARFHDGADTERLQIEQTLPASDARPIADEKANGEEGGPFEPPLVLRRMAE
ncbi:MAG TPA: hypothetical protein VH852_03550 [Hyphomicrobium sp.]|jgi:hypothetical protein